MPNDEVTVKFSRKEALKLDLLKGRIFPRDLEDSASMDDKLLYSALAKAGAARFDGKDHR